MRIIDKLRTRYKVCCRICGHFDSDMTTVHEVMEEAAQVIEVLVSELDHIQLAYIEAANPGIDMDRVRSLRGELDLVLLAARASNRATAHAQEQRLLDAMRSPDA
jgi:cell division FtsZ-interacting protein ZapD